MPMKVWFFVFNSLPLLSLTLGEAGQDDPLLHDLEVYSDDGLVRCPSTGQGRRLATWRGRS